MRLISHRPLLTLAVQVALAATLMPAAQAGTSAADQPITLGKISVSGKPLPPVKRHEPLPAVPIQVISQQQLEASGATSLGDFLQQLTSMGSAANTAQNFGANGETNINLRNLGSTRVLVLVNGRRWTPTLGGDVDLNTIPLAIVERIEILKSGDSAQYGSGAIAGVVNIITRRNFNGSQASAYFGEYVEGGARDGQTSAYSYTDGHTSDHGSLIFNASYYDQRSVPGADRAISAVPRYGTGITRGSSVTPQGRFEFINPNTGQLEDLTVINGTPGTSPADFTSFNPATDLFNYAPYNYLLTPAKRSALYVQGERLLSDNIRLHYTGFYNDSRSAQQVGPSELSIGAQTPNAISVSAGNPYNPFGFDLSATGANPNLLLLARQPVEAGPNHFTEDEQTSYFNAGVDGRFAWAERVFDWSVDGIYSRFGKTNQQGPVYNLNNVANALGPVSQCGPGSVHPACVPLNLFGGQYQGGTITPAMLNYITYTSQNTSANSLRDVTAHLGTDLLQLPAGPLHAQVVYEHFSQDGSSTPDPLAAAGESSVGASAPTSGAFQDSAFGLYMKIPFTAGLGLDAAARRDRYSNFGSVNSNLAALHWQVNPAVLLRASWSRDFRAPAMNDLYSGSLTGTNSLTDPCSNYTRTGGVVAANCAAAGVPTSYTQVNPDITTVTGGNPALKPETSTSRTVGGDFTPWNALPLRLSVDYFNIQVNNAISQLSPQSILNGCYLSGVSNLCGFVNRNASGAITGLNDSEVNIGTLRTAGMDFGAHYILDTADRGRIEFQWLTTWVKYFTQIQPNLANPAAPIVTQLAGTETGNPVGGYPGFRSEFDAGWHYGAWQVTWRVHYLSDLTEPCSDGLDGTPQSFTNLGLCSNPDYRNNALSTNKLGATTWHDVQVQYTLPGSHTTLRFGVLNVFDKQPPIGHSMADSFDTTLYPIPGRFPYVSISHSF